MLVVRPRGLLAGDRAGFDRRGSCLSGQGRWRDRCSLGSCRSRSSRRLSCRWYYGGQFSVLEGNAGVIGETYLYSVDHDVLVPIGYTSERMMSAPAEYS